MKDMKFVIIILLIFFGAGIMAQINDYDYNVNNTGIMYQENNNIALNENNRYYDYNIYFNVDESYLHYSPVKKGGLLDSLYNDKSKNLAMPDLTGKEYLGDGEYLVIDSNRKYFYNIYSGIWTIEGGSGGTNQTLNTDIFINSFSTDIDYVVTVNFIVPLTSGLLSFQTSSSNDKVNGVSSGYNEYILDKNSDILYIKDAWASTDGVKFTLQLEKGDTATPYTVPYIPALQIAFNGTNQVEYINPFVEQIIKIDDIDNVYNVDFELLNTKNPVVFNWNITTNPNMPFVRFYNNETKLLYDFTDINEMNSIGNSLISSRSNMLNIFNNALDLVNTFYEGFQKLFNTDTIESIKDALSGVWPLLPPKWPWIIG